jgi:hypothetical protein
MSTLHDELARAYDAHMTADIMTGRRVAGAILYASHAARIMQRARSDGDIATAVHMLHSALDGVNAALRDTTRPADMTALHDARETIYSAMASTAGRPVCTGAKGRKVAARRRRHNRRVAQRWRYHGRPACIVSITHALRSRAEE